MTDEPPADEPPSRSDRASDPPRAMTGDTDPSHPDDTDATDRAATDPGDADPTDRTPTDSDGTDADDGSAQGDPDSSGTDRLSASGLRGLLDRVGLAALSLLAVVAGWGFYSQSGNAIRTWFDPAYQPIALAVFNLAVLLVALAGVTHQLRRIRATGPSGSE